MVRNMASASPISVHALRLHPGDDLLECLAAYVKATSLRAAFVVTCVGSLTNARLRFANKPHATELVGHFEIVSLVGTFSGDAGAHLHTSISDGEGRVIGGHVLPGCIVYTTAEVVLGEASELVFSRPTDPATTWDELLVESRTGHRVAVSESPLPLAVA